MNKKTIHKVNGSIAIYYGISCIAGAIGAVIGLGIWLFNVFNNQTHFSWGTVTGLVVIIAVLGALGYSIFRVGHEEIEK